MKVTQPLECFCKVAANWVNRTGRTLSFWPRLGRPMALTAAIALLLVSAMKTNAQSPATAQPSQAGTEISKALVPSAGATDRTAKAGAGASALREEIREMRRSIEQLRSHVNELEIQVNQLQAERHVGGGINAGARLPVVTFDPPAPNCQVLTTSAPDTSSASGTEAIGGLAAGPDAEPPPAPAADQSQAKEPDNKDRAMLDFLHDTTINLALDTYYDYNFNHPIGRVNLLRAYDVLSNSFSLNQADIVF